MSALRYLMLFAASTSACMLTPTDDQRVSNTSAPLRFSGYTTRAGAPVQVRAWDFQSNAMVNVGGPVAAGSTSTHADPPLFGWQVDRVLTPRQWRAGPDGGKCAVVGARTTVDGRTYDVMTVERNWQSCYDEHPDATEFYQHCGSSNTPVAKLYTTDWGTSRLGPTELALAAYHARDNVRLTLDNYTPTAYEHCRAGNPNGCPPGLGADPELYKFYRPQGSSLNEYGGSLAFSMTPWREGPMTVYVDDLRSRAFAFTTRHGRLEVEIVCEAAGVEIRKNCVRDAGCAVADGQTVDFRSPYATVAFELAIEDDRITYTDVSATFSTGTPGSTAATTGDLLARAIADKLMDPQVRSSMSAALHDSLTRAVELDGYPVQWVSIDSTGMTLQTACPMD